MSKKIINLGKVKARTKELRLNDTVIEHKYDDEAEWQPLVDLGETGSSIETVPGYSDLPTDARENDVAIVEEAEYVRTENKTTVLPIELKPNAEDQDMPNIYNIHFKDDIGSILEDEELKKLGAEYFMLGLEGEFSYIHHTEVSPKLATSFIGADNHIKAMQIAKDEYNMYFYVHGMSIRDYMQMTMDIDLDEEQLNIFLGDYANDNTADNPSYGWMYLTLTSEPVNENSVDFDGIYGTLIFNIEAPKINDMVGYISVSARDINDEEVLYASASAYSHYESSSYDPEERARAFKYVNIAIDYMANGGVIEQSNDIYNPKGLFQHDNGEWVSLEEKMNTPRFVDTYADLPKSCIENGIMAVAKESKSESKGGLTTILESLKRYKINSVNNMTIEDYDDMINELLPNYPTDASSEYGIYCYIPEKGAYFTVYGMKGTIASEDELMCALMVEYSKEAYKEEEGFRAFYVMECPDDFDAGNEWLPEDKETGEYIEFYPQKNTWYWAKIIGIDEGKEFNTYVDGGIQEGFPVDLIPDFFFYNAEVYWDSEAYPVGGDDDYKYFTKIDTKAFVCEDLSIPAIVYPAGFYRYQNNEWVHVEDVSGGNFDNEDVLKSITAEDVGNIKENTEKRHYHDNKHYLDQIQYESIYRINNDIPQNTSARHTHENKEIIDKLTQNHLDEINKINNNTTQIEEILEGYKVVYHTSEREPSSVNLVNNHFLYLGGAIRPENFSINFPNNGKCGILFALGGEDSSYSTARKHITFSKRVFWENNIEPPFETFLNEKNARRILLFFEVISPSYVIGKWFLDSVRAYYHEWDDIENKLLPPNSVSKFAKIENNQLIFAPQIIDNTFNLDNEELYFSKNYKKVYGNNPYELSKTITLNDQFKIYYKEFEDFIYVYWLVTPKDSYIGDYINSSCFENFNNTFQNFEGESINEFIYLGELDTSNSTSFERTFQDCVNLKELPQMDTSKAINFHNMCLGCSNLELVPEIDLTAYATSNVTVTSLNIFYNCSSLTTIEKIIVPECNWSAVTSFFNEALVSSLENVTLKANVKLDCDWSKLSQCPNLTVDSLMSFINAFQDNINYTQYTLTIGATNLAKLTEDQILIATNKNILLA